AVNDFITLWASTRRGGRSLADIARTEIGPVAGTIAAVAVLSILIIALAGLGIAVVNALAESAWSTFTIGATIPIGIAMGFHMFVFRKGNIREATIVGVFLMIFAVLLGRPFANSSAGPYLVLSRHQITAALAMYGFAGSVLPVWMLLTPRGYLSTFMKIGTIAFLAVGVMALIAATALHPGDYFAINTTASVFQGLGMPAVNLAALQTAVGENVVARPGGAVSLAVGMAQIFSGLPGMRGLMAYWYHFAIMFEAVFILTTIDAGTRIGRFLLQEFGGRMWKPFGRTDWVPGSLISTFVIVIAWAYFIWTGSISTIWP